MGHCLLFSDNDCGDDHFMTSRGCLLYNVCRMSSVLHPQDFSCITFPGYPILNISRTSRVNLRSQYQCYIPGLVIHMTFIRPLNTSSHAFVKIHPKDLTRLSLLHLLGSYIHPLIILKKYVPSISLIFIKTYFSKECN